jgi:hypothetical protein
MAERPVRRRRLAVGVLFAVALITGLIAMFAVWIDRQALNPKNGTEVSSKLLANDEIRGALGTYLVDQLFSSVDVPAAIQNVLPPRADALAAPAAAGLQQLANDRAPRLLARPRIEDAWRKANLAARTALVNLVEGKHTGRAVSTNGGDEVVLDLHVVVQQLAGELGLTTQLAAAQGKLRQRGIKIPQSAGQLVLVKSSQIGTVQDVAGAIKGLAVWMTVLTFALFALAVWLAEGWRRVALRRVGWCLIALGVLVVLARRVVGNQVIDGLVASATVQPPAKAAWTIITQNLYDQAAAVVAYGVIIVAAAWLAGATRPAYAVRQAIAPALKYQLGAVYGAVAFVYLLVLVWGPTPATTQAPGIIGSALLIVLGVEVLRRQVAREFPDVQPGDTSARLRAWRSGARARRGGAATSPGTPVARVTTPDGQEHP